MLELEPPLDPNRSYSFIAESIEPQRFRVTRIRERDGRWFVTGTDLEAREEHSFYLDAVEYLRPCVRAPGRDRMVFQPFKVRYALHALVEYIPWNPVRRGLVKQPED